MHCTKSWFCLQVEASKAALEACGLEPNAIDSVYVGNVHGMITPCALYMSRHTAIRLGCRKEIPCLTVSKLCGSGFQAIVNSIQDLMVGDSNIILTGGSDNMSDSPFALKGFRFGMRLGSEPKTYDMLWASLSDSYVNMPMGLTAEKLGEKFNLTRQEVDEYALLSQQRWKKAYDNGEFFDEIAQVEVKTRKGVVNFAKDEHPKPDTTMEGLAKLPTIFKKNGLVTPGNASGICDGAGALILANEHAVDKYDLKPLAKIVGYGLGGCEPETMGYAPVPAVRGLLDKTGYTLDDVDQLEINEAFGAQVPMATLLSCFTSFCTCHFLKFQVLACQKELDFPMEKFNSCGGAIAVGHPIAATGARISAHVVHKLRRNNEKIGIASACIAGGQVIDDYGQIENVESAVSQNTKRYKEYPCFSCVCFYLYILTFIGLD